MEMLRKADLRAAVAPMVIMSGFGASHSGRVSYVPPTELLERAPADAKKKGLVVVEHSAKYRDALTEEMREMRAGTGSRAAGTTA